MTDQDIDPFAERARVLVRGPLQLMGGRFRFESNSDELLSLVDHAYAGLPRHTLSKPDPRMTVRLLLLPSRMRARRSSEPLPIEMLSGAGLLGGATGTSNTVVISPGERAALVIVSPEMLRFQYHTRYELIEFAVFTLAVRAQQLASLHGACVGLGGRGVLLMGESGTGKSTVALQCLLEGFEFLSEDSVFVEPATLRATGVANFLHVRSDSLRWVAKPRDSARIIGSPVIRRRSGVQKFEVDLRGGGYNLARSPLQVAAIVFLSARKAHKGPLLKPLTRPELLRRLVAEQGYAANRPGWSTFERNLNRVEGFELRRGSHPGESAQALRYLLARPVPATR
jgi:HPr Serine kinase C-terminal domain